MDRSLLRPISPTNDTLPHADVSRIATVIAGRSVCVDCLASETGQAVTQGDEAFASIRTTLGVISEVALCDHCLKQTVVHRLG
jgi:hypothetical protein